MHSLDETSLLLYTDEFIEIKSLQISGIDCAGWLPRMEVSCFNLKKKWRDLKFNWNIVYLPSK